MFKRNFYLFLLLTLISTFILTGCLQQKTGKVINSFEECLRAGYPVMESYPRQCKGPEGKTFVEELEEGAVKENLLLTQKTILLTSPAFKNNQNLPSKYTCDGEGINPPLVIDEVPEGTQSLVLISEDPDAVIGTFVHWLVWNIDPQTKEIPENSVPQGAVEGITDFGRPGYGPPCPPSGVHRYYFRIYALDTRPDLSSKINKASLEKAIQGHILGQAELFGLYGRD